MTTTSALGPLTKKYDDAGVLLGIYDAEGNLIISVGAGDSSSNGGSFYLGAVAGTSDLADLTSAVVGSTSMVGVSPNDVLYELRTLPYSVEANWQPLQGTVPDGTTITIELVEGKLPRTLLVMVPTGNQVTVTVGGTTLPVLTEAVLPHSIYIGDEPGVAAPTSVTIQRTAGSAATGWFSLQGG